MYQVHSKTSENAYRKLESSKADAEKIFKLVESAGLEGISAPWVAEKLDMVPGTVAARVIGLERDGLIVKLQREQKSPSNRPANVMIDARLKAEALSRGENILVTKIEGKKGAGAGDDAEVQSVLDEVANLVALGSPILYGSKLHLRIKALLK